MEGHHGETALRGFMGSQEIGLVIPHGRAEPGAVGENAAVCKPHRKGCLLTRQVLTIVLSVRPVDLGHLGEQQIVARFHERSPSPLSIP